MSRTPKQRFIGEITALLSSVSVTPQPGQTLISQPLHDAILEIQDEVKRPRTNWHLVTAVSAVKSYICTIDQGQTVRDPFWAEERPGDQPSVYMILDSLHFRAAMRVGGLPSGMTMYIGTPDGIGKQSGEVDTSASPSSPTLRLISEEMTRIEARAAKERDEPVDD